MLNYIDRHNTDSIKWDGQTAMFGEEGLHAMWVADMDFAVADCVKEALRAYVDAGVYGYMKVPDSYYDACIEWEEKNHGFRMEKEWIRFSPGVVSGFYWLVQMLSQPGDGVLVTTPVYYPFLNAVKDNGRTLVTSELVVKDGRYVVDYEDFERKIEEGNVRIFILCSPHNPVGRVWEKEELVQMFEICRRHQVYVISDEIHQDLVFGDSKHIPSFLAGDYNDRIVSLYAPSKTFNLAGAQNSEVIIPDEKLREKWDAFVAKIHVNQGNSFGYIAAEAAYRGGKTWLDEVRAQISENFDYLKQAFAKELPEAVVTPLEGTYLAWIDLRAYVKPCDIHAFMQEKCKIAADYGEWFGGDSFAGFVRLNLATSLENTKIGAERIIKAICG